VKKVLDAIANNLSTSTFPSKGEEGIPAPSGKFQRLIRLSIVGREGVIVKEDSVDLSKNRNRINSL